MSSLSSRKEIAQSISSLRPINTKDFLLATFDNIDTPISSYCSYLLQAGKIGELLDVSLPLDRYTCSDRLRDDLLAVSLMSKYGGSQISVSTPDERANRAFDKFLEAELACRSTNHRLRNLGLDPLYKGANVWLLSATQRKISQILGKLDGDFILQQSNWGPGTTVSIRGTDTTRQKKFLEDTSVTLDASTFVSELVIGRHDSHGNMRSCFPLWGQHVARQGLTVVSGSRIITVPKSAKIDRVICVEPGMNSFFQKGVGSLIKYRLSSRTTIDLNDQTLNQELCKVASVTGDLATVDFSSASDTISLETVRQLLPADWFLLMDTLRSKVGTLPNKKVVQFEKFSSMGNGFTFELESLIFYAAAAAVHEYLAIDAPIGTYGDDVIIAVGAAELYSSFCSFLGFKVNERKTHVTGLYRESCGSHYLNGICVKPFFLREDIDHPAVFFKVINAFRERRKLQGVRSYLKKKLPRPLRLDVPLSFGDVGIGCIEASNVRPFIKNGYMQFEFPILKFKGKREVDDTIGALLHGLSRTRGDEDASASERIHRGRESYEVHMTTISHWMW